MLLHTDVLSLGVTETTSSCVRNDARRIHRAAWQRPQELAMIIVSKPQIGLIRYNQDLGYKSDAAYITSIYHLLTGALSRKASATKRCRCTRHWVRHHTFVHFVCLSNARPLCVPSRAETGIGKRPTGDELPSKQSAFRDRPLRRREQNTVLYSQYTSQERHLKTATWPLCVFPRKSPDLSFAPPAHSRPGCSGSVVFDGAPDTREMTDVAQGARRGVDPAAVNDPSGKPGF